MKLKDWIYALLGALGLLAAAAAFLFVVLGVISGGARGAVSTLKYAVGLGVIRRNYVGEADAAQLTDAALAAAVDSLGDRWSYYMDEEAYAAYQDTAANRYQGIGVTISKDEKTGGFRIEAITKDGPAQQAGLLAGDIILAVDGVDVTQGTTEDIKALIQAAYGKNAVVTVLREDGTTVDFTVSCEEVYDSPVSFELLEAEVGYVRIENFRAGAGEKAAEAVKELLALGAESLVFDVRDNPGGQVSELVALLDYLLPEGDIFVRADRKGREAVEVSGDDCVEMPMAVLVNARSYSAAEYFAAALREYDRALVVGEATTGKARSQVTVALFDQSAIHLSRYSYLTPQRMDLYEAGGLSPDVEAVLTEEEYVEFATGWLGPEEDPQVLAAVEALSA